MVETQQPSSCQMAGHATNCMHPIPLRRCYFDSRPMQAFTSPTTTSTVPKPQTPSPINDCNPPHRLPVAIGRPVSRPSICDLDLLLFLLLLDLFQLRLLFRGRRDFVPLQRPGGPDAIGWGGRLCRGGGGGLGWGRGFSRGGL
jgi:hypothetical protein